MSEVEKNETGPEPLREEKPEAVEVSQWTKTEVYKLKGALTHEIEGWASRENVERLKEELGNLIEAWEEAARKLPEPRRRGKNNQASEEWMRDASRELQAVHLSWLRIWSLVKVWAKLLLLRRGEAVSPREVLRRKGVLDTEGYRLYSRLRSWLYRRTEAGKRKQTEYTHRPEVRARRQLSAERERTRKAEYRARKRAEAGLGVGMDIEPHS